MGLQYTRVGGGSLDGGSYREMAKNLRNIYAEEMEDAGKAGVGEAEGFIDMAGTGNTWRWNGRDGAGAGRIDSGLMRAKLDYRLTRGQSIGLDVGWVDFWREYFGAQDAGFSAGGARPDQAVEGMGMLAHLRVYMRGKVDGALDRAGERIINGL